VHAHTVFFWLKADQSADNAADFEAGLTALIKGAGTIAGHFGKPASSEVREVVDDSYSYGLILHFTDQADHDRYQASDVHLRFVDAHSHRWDGVVVYDTKC